MTIEERQKAAKWFQNRASNTSMPGAKMMFERAAEALSEEIQPHWIPCSERLPDSGRYLVSCSLSVFSPQVVNYDADDGEWFYDGCKSIGYEMPTIIAWMPLPKQYGDESDDR